MGQVLRGPEVEPRVELVDDVAWARETVKHTPTSRNTPRHSSEAFRRVNGLWRPSALRETSAGVPVRVRLPTAVVFIPNAQIKHELLFWGTRGENH